jgi:hypothetical protein
VNALVVYHCDICTVLLGWSSLRSPPSSDKGVVPMVVGFRLCKISYTISRVETVLQNGEQNGERFVILTSLNILLDPNSHSKCFFASTFNGIRVEFQWEYPIFPRVVVSI